MLNICLTMFKKRMKTMVTVFFRSSSIHRLRFQVLVSIQQTTTTNRFFKFVILTWLWAEVIGLCEEFHIMVG